MKNVWDGIRVTVWAMRISFQLDASSNKFEELTWHFWSVTV